MNFCVTGYLCRVASQFSKQKMSNKNGGHFKFSNFLQKIAKHKNAYISKTVLDRGISTKFLICRESLNSSHPNFQKNFVSLKMAAILNFLQKMQNTKMLKSRKPY